MDAANKDRKNLRDYEFRSVGPDDLKREQIVEDFIGEHLSDWQARGWVPDMRIEPGYNTDQPIRDAWLDALAPSVSRTATADSWTHSQARK